MEIEDILNKYLTKRFICDPSELPEDECLQEAKHIISLIRQHIPEEKAVKEILYAAGCPDCLLDHFSLQIYRLMRRNDDKDAV